MAARRSSRSGPLVRVLVLAVGTTALISGMLGYLAGSYAPTTGTPATQDEFVTGAVTGALFRGQHEPEVLCAAKFYPHRPDAMSGCLQGLERPSGGYRLPG